MCQALDQSARSIEKEVSNDKRTIDRFPVGRTESVWPVHASRAFPASIQSSVPSRCTTAKELPEDLVDISAFIGVVETTLW